jgi:hypothetical protein
MKSRNKKNKTTIVLPTPTSKRTELAPFLKVSDISEKGTTEIALLGSMRKSNSRFGEGIELACTVGGKRFIWTVKFSSINYSLLYERFGRKTWKGIVKVERKEHMGHEYIAVVE